VKANLITLSLATVLTLLCASARPAAAGTIYDNGPINGNVDAWTVNFGFVVSDTFTISGGNGTITGLSFGTFSLPGDTLLSIELSITSSEFGGTTYFDQVVNTTESDCHSNQYGYNVCTQSATFNGPNLAPGTYWLNLQNAFVDTGDPIYWDENSGVGCQSPGCPSQASDNSVGTIPSESFTVEGTINGGTVPEPGSLLLLASGVTGVVGVLRRRVKRS